MSKAEKTRLYNESLITARGGLATLRKWSGNPRLDPCEDKRIVADAVLIAGECSCPPEETFKVFFRKCIFKAINRLHNETRTDRGRKEIQVVEEPMINRVSADHFTPTLDDTVHQRQMRSKYKKLLATVMAKSRNRGPGRTYMERLSNYADQKYTTKEIAEDLGRTPEDVHQYRLRAIRILKIEDK